MLCHSANLILHCFNLSKLHTKILFLSHRKETTFQHRDQIVIFVLVHIRVFLRELCEIRNTVFRNAVLHGRTDGLVTTNL